MTIEFFSREPLQKVQAVKLNLGKSLSVIVERMWVRLLLSRPVAEQHACPRFPWTLERA